ncbi:MAG: phosphodiester glycosidase family protein [Treponema sp.]|nr:phosphodiester glycosidase family protein [Treponema sp.]
MSGKFYDKKSFFSVSHCSLIRNRRLLAVFVVFLVLSCSSFSPVSAPPERGSQKFASPYDVVPYWQPFAADLTEGLDFFAGQVQNPRLRFWAVRVDLTAESLGFVVSPREPVNAVMQDGIIPSTKISSFVERYHCLIGINTNPFSPVSGREGEERTIIGVTVSQGTVVALPHPSYDALVFYADSSAAIVKQSELQDLEGVEYAVGGFSIVLQNGTLPDRLLSSRTEPRHPRSAAGLSADGKTLYLLVIDGRQLGSIGATESEISAVLKGLGAFEGLNFDGGGSTALALRYPNGKVRTVNTPIHKGVPNLERGVGTCFGIVLR